MVGARECAFTEPALKGPVTGVFPVVPGEFVRARKLPAAFLPVALVGLFTGMRPEVSFQVGALGVALAAALMRTGVDGDFLPAEITLLTLLHGAA